MSCLLYLLHPIPRRGCCSKLKLIVRCSVYQWVDSSCEQILWIWKLVTAVLWFLPGPWPIRDGTVWAGERWCFLGDECRGCKYTLDSRSPEWLRKYCLATCTEHLRAMVAFWFDCRKGNLKNNLSYSLSTYRMPNELAWLFLGCVLQELGWRTLKLFGTHCPHPLWIQQLHPTCILCICDSSLWGRRLPLKCSSVDGGCWLRRA